MVFAQLRRNVREIEFRVNVLLGFARNEQLGIAGFLLGLEQAV